MCGCRLRAGLHPADCRPTTPGATLREARATLERLEDVSRLSGGKVPARTELDAARASADRAAAADVARAGMAAQLELASANAATHQRALEAMARAADAYKELARVASAQPPLPGLPAGAHGVDQLLAALDVARAILPAEPAAGGDRPASDGGGLPGGAGAAGGPDDAGGPATVPEA